MLWFIVYLYNFCQFSGLAVATCWTFVLPSVKKIEFKLETQTMILIDSAIENKLEQDNEDNSVEKTIEVK